MTYREQRESRNQGPAINLKSTYPVTYISSNFQNTTNCRVPSIEGKIHIHAIILTIAHANENLCPQRGVIFAAYKENNQ